MKKITEEHLEHFLIKFHYLHDCSIISSYYDIREERIELVMDLYWKNQEKVDSDKKIKLVFQNVQKYNNKEISTCDFINKIYIKYVTLEDKKLICFANEEKNPFIYIVCEKMEYEEL